MLLICSSLSPGELVVIRRRDGWRWAAQFAASGRC